MRKELKRKKEASSSRNLPLFFAIVYKAVKKNDLKWSYRKRFRGRKKNCVGHRNRICLGFEGTTSLHCTFDVHWTSSTYKKGYIRGEWKG
jgi:hypothetical protein